MMDNRNLYGFTLFTFILLTAVFIKFAFFAHKTVLHPPQIYVETTTDTHTSCFPQIEKPLAEPVNLATLDLKTGLVNLSLDLNRQLNFESHNGFAVTLHFFTKDGRQPRELAVEKTNIRSETVDNDTNIANVRLTCSADWLNRLKANQSLYVIARVAPGSREAKNSAVDFNDAEAVPVLLIAGKH